MSSSNILRARRKRAARLLTAGVAGLSMFAVAACSSAEEGSPEPSQSTGVENASGEVLMLGSSPQEDFDPVAAAFNDAHPDITLTYLSLRGDAILQRLDAERAAGRATASLIMSPLHPQFYDMVDDGELLEYASPNEEAYDPWFVNPGYWIGVRVLVPSLVYNTNAVSEEPTWEDLQNPDHRGRVGLTDAGVLGSLPLTFYKVLKEQLGDDFWPGVVGNDPTILQLTGQILEEAINGQLDIGWIYDYQTLGALAEQPDLPIAATWPSPTALSYSALAIPANAPNAEAAKVVYDWMTSAEGQQVIANGGKTLSAHPDVTYDVDRPTLDDLDWEKYDIRQDLLETAAGQQEWNSVFGRS